MPTTDVNELGSSRTKVKRLPKRGTYDFATIARILDEGLVCHIGIVQDNQPFVLPMIYGRLNKNIYIHGSTASRLMKTLIEPTCISVTIVDGLVLARSAFHHSMNYRSVVVVGEGRKVDDASEKIAALKAISDHIMPGRYEGVRGPNKKEMRATQVIAFAIDEASAKIRSGPPVDDEEDYALGMWAGVVPLNIKSAPPEADPRLHSNIAIPEYLEDYGKKTK